ncbi:hypothetical protein M231_00853 [Tremella mesenterica]|uniref:Uncharacterized protein n=1 Tax=Tremella mesenterica TaxID=5217 RepID=A0A4Q1BUP6_TREME|nr:hypothetical protein M231_00853 [Tremella mesenterica]
MPEDIPLLEIPGAYPRNVTRALPDASNSTPVTASQLRDISRNISRTAHSELHSAMDRTNSRLRVIAYISGGAAVLSIISVVTAGKALYDLWAVQGEVLQLASFIDKMAIQKREVDPTVEPNLGSDQLLGSSLGSHDPGTGVGGTLYDLIWDSDRQEGILKPVTGDKIIEECIPPMSEGAEGKSDRSDSSKTAKADTNLDVPATDHFVICPSQMSKFLPKFEEHPFWMVSGGEVTRATLKPIAPFGRGSPTGEQDPTVKVGDKWYTLEELPSGGDAGGEINE